MIGVGTHVSLVVAYRLYGVYIGCLGSLLCLNHPEVLRF